MTYFHSKCCWIFLASIRRRQYMRDMLTFCHGQPFLFVIKMYKVCFTPHSCLIHHTFNFCKVTWYKSLTRWPYRATIVYYTYDLYITVEISDHISGWQPVLLLLGFKSVYISRYQRNPYLHGARYSGSRSGSRFSPWKHSIRIAIFNAQFSVRYVDFNN